MNKVLLGNKNGENRFFLCILEIETIEGWKHTCPKVPLFSPFDLYGDFEARISIG